MKTAPAKEVEAATKVIDLDNLGLKGLNEEQKAKAKQLGYSGMFADRETLQEAYDYAMEVAKACGSNEVGVITAIHVLINTFAKGVAKEMVK